MARRIVGDRIMSPKRIVPPLLLAVVAGILIWRWAVVRDESEDGLVASGTIEATDAQLGFQVPGRIAAIAVREGDRVEAGAEIARLDAAETEARRAQAAASAAAARAALAELEAGFRSEEIAGARAAAAAATERVADAERDRERAETLWAGRAISREALDKAGSALDVARAQRDQAAEQLRLLERGPRAERLDAARAQLAQVEAALAAIDVVLGNHRLVAPFAGTVTVRHREPGEIVPAGAAVVTLLDLDDRWVRIYVPENRLGAVRLGQPAAIVADTFPGKSYGGEVAFIASEAEFTPKNVQTAEERVRLVYAVKVRVTGDPGHELKPGLPADVRLLEEGA
jgi:HlyD family secretion protein